MAMHTALDLITASLKRLGVISGIETPAADLAADGLDRLNSLIDTWISESLFIYASLVVDTPLVSGQATYTIGLPGGDIATPRPLWINSATLVLAGSPSFEYPLVTVSDDRWQAEQTKALTSAQPTHLYYNPTYPLGTITVWPGPTGASQTLRLYLPQQLSSWPTLTTAVDLPPGYYRALRDNLAIELAPELDKTPEGPLVQAAVEAQAAVKRINYRPHLMRVDETLPGFCGGGYDWRVDR